MKCPYCELSGPFAMSALKEGRLLCVGCGESWIEGLKEPEELKIVRNERAVVANAIRDQENARRILLMVSTPDSGTVPTTLDRDEALQLWEWLGSWLRHPD